MVEKTDRLDPYKVAERLIDEIRELRKENERLKDSLKEVKE